MRISFAAGQQKCALGLNAFSRMKHHVLRSYQKNYHTLLCKWERDKANEVYEGLLRNLKENGHQGAMFFIIASDTDWEFTTQEVRAISPVLEKTDFAAYEMNKGARKDMFAVRDLFDYAARENIKVEIHQERRSR